MHVRSLPDSPVEIRTVFEIWWNLCCMRMGWMNDWRFEFACARRPNATATWRASVSAADWDWPSESARFVRCSSTSSATMLLPPTFVSLLSVNCHRAWSSKTLLFVAIKYSPHCNVGNCIPTLEMKEKLLLKEALNKNSWFTVSKLGLDRSSYMTLSISKGRYVLLYCTLIFLLVVSFSVSQMFL